MVAFFLFYEAASMRAVGIPVNSYFIKTALANGKSKNALQKRLTL